MPGWQKVTLKEFYEMVTKASPASLGLDSLYYIDDYLLVDAVLYDIINRFGFDKVVKFDDKVLYVYDEDAFGAARVRMTPIKEFYGYRNFTLTHVMMLIKGISYYPIDLYEDELRNIRHFLITSSLVIDDIINRLRAVNDYLKIPLRIHVKKTSDKDKCINRRRACVEATDSGEVMILIDTDKDMEEKTYTLNELNELENYLKQYLPSAKQYFSNIARDDDCDDE
jgi:hypothetical protein